MSKTWSSPEIEFLTKRLGDTTKDIYQAYDTEFDTSRSYDSIQKKIKRLRDLIYDMQAEPEEEIFEEINDIIENSSLKIANVTPAQRRQDKKDAREWLQQVVEITRDNVYQSNDMTSGAVRSDQSSLVVVMSDTHYGKHTPYFNLEIAKERAKNLPEQIYSATLPVIDEVVLVLAGDMVEGEDIYATQNNHIECPVFEQTQVCSESLWEVILTFRKLFQCRVRIETCPGNHGRMSKTANERTNWDNVVYHILHLMAKFHGDPEIIINTNFNTMTTFPVKDRVGLAYHHGVKHTGTPAMREKIAGWNKTKKFDFLVHGHWHEWHVGNWMGKFVLGNGCMCGPDDLAETMGKEDDARQGWFLITPGKPIWGFSFVEWPTQEIKKKDE
jgi:predicted phosphodiesterase